MPKTTVGEIQLYYEQHGKGEPLILIPGFAAGIWIWFRQRAALAQNFQVVTFDPRGVNRSDKPEGPQTIRLIADDAACLLRSKLIADGTFHDHMGIYAGGTHLPVTAQVIEEGMWNKVRFARKYPVEVNLEGWPAIIAEVLQKCHLTQDDIKLFLFTQVNLSTIKEVMRIMDLPMSRTHTIMQKWGYTGSACIPMVLDDAVREGKLKPGDNVVMCASGGGLNMACVAFRW